MEPLNVQSSQSARPIFNEYDKKYSLWCCHIRNWAIAIGVLEVISLIANVGLMISNGGASEEYYSNYSSMASGNGLTSKIISVFIWAVVLILYFLGIKKESQCLLIPHLVVQGLAILGFLILGIWVLCASAETVLVILGIICLIAVVIEIFFMYVIVRCLKFFSEKRAADAQNTYIGVVSHGLDITDRDGTPVPPTTLRSYEPSPQDMPPHYEDPGPIPSVPPPPYTLSTDCATGKTSPDGTMMA